MANETVPSMSVGSTYTQRRRTRAPWHETRSTDRLPRAAWGWIPDSPCWRAILHLMELPDARKSREEAARDAAQYGERWARTDDWLYPVRRPSASGFKLKITTRSRAERHAALVAIAPALARHHIGIKVLPDDIADTYLSSDILIYLPRRADAATAAADVTQCAHSSESGHPFRLKAATHSDGKRPASRLGGRCHDYSDVDGVDGSISPSIGGPLGAM